MPAIATCPSCGTRNRVPASATGTPRCAQCHSPLPWIVNAGDDDFAEATGGKTPVLVDLWAPWCGPCRQVSPVLERIAGERAGAIKLVKVNVDESPRTQAKFGVQAIPTLIVMRGGKEIGRQQGAGNHAQLVRWLDSVLN